jgi:hypothetical protein
MRFRGRVVTLSLVGIAAVGIIAVAVPWSGRTGGPDAYDTELSTCQGMLDQALQNPQKEFIDGTVWYSGDANRLSIGGQFRTEQYGGRLQQYECLVVNGMVVAINVK